VIINLVPVRAQWLVEAAATAETGIEESEPMKCGAGRRLIPGGMARHRPEYWVVLAYVFGRRKDEVFPSSRSYRTIRYQKVLYRWLGAYERHFSVEVHEVGKRKTQRIERKYLRLRTRIKV